MQISKNLEENVVALKEMFENCMDIVIRDFLVSAEKRIFLFYVDNMIDSNGVREFVMFNLMSRYESVEISLERIESDALAVGETKKLFEIAEVVAAVLAGEVVLLMDGDSFALQTSLKLFPSRGVSKAETEVVVQGPKDAFLEVGAMNIVLIRRRIRDKNLKLMRFQVGTTSKTDVALMFMENLVRPKTLKKIQKQLEEISQNGIFDSGSLEQLLEKQWISPFPQLQLTERPDKASASLLEGRVVLVVDNTPFVVLLPATLNVFFQASDDYYDRFFMVGFVRVMRYLAAFGAIFLPAIYVALAAYHTELFPTAFAIKIAQTRQDIPFSVVGEVILMELAFELLREAGIRLPSPVSSTIGIVGGIIIGSAAVEAGIVSPFVVILSALTGIFTFAIPNIALVSALRVCKYCTLFFAMVLGLFGVWLSGLLILIHLAHLNSYGIPYLFPFCSGSANQGNDWEDSIIRMPLQLMKQKTIFMRKKEKGGD